MDLRNGIFLNNVENLNTYIFCRETTEAVNSKSYDALTEKDDVISSVWAKFADLAWAGKHLSVYWVHLV